MASSLQTTLQFIRRLEGEISFGFCSRDINRPPTLLPSECVEPPDSVDAPSDVVASRALFVRLSETVIITGGWFNKFGVRT
jgi:hypothetical protein